MGRELDLPEGPNFEQSPPKQIKKETNSFLS